MPSFASALELKDVPGSGRTEACLCCCGPYLIGMNEPPYQRVTVWSGADVPLGNGCQLKPLYSLPGELSDLSTCAGEGPHEEPVVVGYLNGMAQDTK
eukprot:scaffold206054_cov42-Prasinocladus_malaysianus.AAC.1